MAVTWPLDLPFVDGKLHSAQEHLDMQEAVNEVYTLADGTASTVTTLSNDVATLQGEVDTLQADVVVVQYSVSVITKLSDNEEIARHTASFKTTFPADFSTAKGYAATKAASVPVTISVLNGASPMGTVVWSVGSNTPTFTTTSNKEQVLDVGDTMVVQQSGTADASFAQASFTLVGAKDG